jgi:hypothetical protein
MNKDIENESILEKLAEMHPIRQAAYASIVQFVVLAFMFGAMALINLIASTT